MTDITVLIADDHPLFRRGLREVVETTEGFHLVAEAGDGETAIRQLELFRPRAAIVDLAMPGRDGLEVLAWATENLPDCRVVIMTAYKEAAYLDRTVELGAAGFMVKDDADQELVRCLQLVMSGGFFVSPSFGTPPAPEPRLVLDDEGAQKVAQLTAQQRLVLRHVAAHLTSKEIARELGISPKTVENHRAKIRDQLSLKGPGSLLEFAVRHRRFL
jgi:DNA-binding NarL/FixJ family response regulator